MKTISPTTVVAGPFRLSYLAVFKPRENEMRGGELEYSAVLLLPKEPHKFCPNPKAELDGIVQAIKTALTAKFGEIPKVYTNCFRNGDKEQNEKGEPKYPGYWFLNVRASTDYPPALIGSDRLPVLGGWNSGDWGKVQINFYAYNYQNKTKGVGAGLQCIQFLYKDEAFGQINDPAVLAQNFDVVEDADGGSAGGAEDDLEDPFASQ